jgi:uncharacterized protein YdhG (YjbR/CyaY superfamily)
MAKTDFKTIDEYINTFPKNIQEKLEKVRTIIHNAVPEAEEVISYQIPCFIFNGPILYFSAFTKHISIAAPPPTIEAFKKDLSEYKTSVSVFQIPIDQPIPEKLITTIAQYRKKENAKRLVAKK